MQKLDHHRVEKISVMSFITLEGVVKDMMTKLR
jgi:hypothetical protein